MFCFLKVRWENLTTFCETRPSRHRVSILSEKGCTAHDARRETPVTHGPAWEQYAFIQNKINRLVTKFQNRVRSPCKRWHIPPNLVVAPRASHNTLDLSIRYPHHVFLHANGI